ncbi:MAG: DUF998 domain-containing protein [Limisphaerales bacterium]
MVLLGTLYFASLRSDYSHISNTISELGETGASHGHLVGFGLFLPVGLLVWLSLWLMHREISDRGASLALAAMSCLGTGYVVSAFLPCDPGSASSWQLAHAGPQPRWILRLWRHRNWVSARFSMLRKRQSDHPSRCFWCWWCAGAYLLGSALLSAGIWRRRRSSAHR